MYLQCHRLRHRISSHCGWRRSSNDDRAALLAGEDFLAGIPIGDIYARGATAQKLIVEGVIKGLGSSGVLKSELAGRVVANTLHPAQPR